MSYINKFNNESYPYEIDVILDPMDCMNLPEWFTDLLLVTHFNENGQPVYKSSRNDDNSHISYYIPLTSNWLNVNSNEVIIRNLGTGNISSLSKDIFESMYVDKNSTSFMNRIKSKFRKLCRMMRISI